MTSRTGLLNSSTKPSELMFARLLRPDCSVLLSCEPLCALSCSAASPQAIVPPVGVVMTPEVCPAAMYGWMRLLSWRRAIYE